MPKRERNRVNHPCGKGEDELRRLCATGESFSVQSKPRAGESFHGRPAIKGPTLEEESFPESSRLLSAAVTFRRSTSTLPCRPAARIPFSLPSFFPADLNYISLRAFSNCDAPGHRSLICPTGKMGRCLNARSRTAGKQPRLRNRRSRQNVPFMKTLCRTVLGWIKNYISTEFTSDLFKFFFIILFIFYVKNNIGISSIKI
ncbi:hypothetical protein PUN28_013201 [Cardiocondyla obscurior]|uniref:Uncharacterized protein n=1 Tax=Cardiocondyla obscurior TaxID=286306 RepID=A0AAW2F8Q7_9HYME